MATTASAVINTTDTAADTPTVPDASVTTKWQEYIWIRHLEAGNVAKAKVYAWNPSATSVATYLKWQEITAAGDFSHLTGSATIAQLPTDITVSNLSIDGAITSTHLAGGITNANLAGSIVYSKITSVDAASVTSVSNSKIPVNTIPTGLTNTNIDSILGSASVDWAKLNVSDGDIPGVKIKDSLVHDQIDSVNATKITTGTLPLARLAYMFERNLPIDTLTPPNATGTYNLHTALGTASATFEGIIRVVVSASSNEVIIALPNPALSAYVGKAAKLSIYRGSSTGKVTIKVCNSGTDSSAFATNKIIDNNNGEITDQVIILPQLEAGDATARKIVVDLICDSTAAGTDNGDGQWIVSGGAQVTGKGKVSVSGIRVGGGVLSPPKEGAQISNVGLGGATAGDDGSPVVVKTNDDNSTGENVGTPTANEAYIFAIAGPVEHGQGYVEGQILTIGGSSAQQALWTTEAEIDVALTEVNSLSYAEGARTNSIVIAYMKLDSSLNRMSGVYTGDVGKIIVGEGSAPMRLETKLATSNGSTGNTPTIHATFDVFFKGIQPLGNDGNVLIKDAWWFDPWENIHKQAP
jgi:hypothetical protein